MPDAQLSIDIISDASNAVAGLNQAGGAVKKLEQTYQVFNNTLNQSVGYQKQQAEKAIEMANAMKQVDASVGDLSNSYKSTSGGFDIFNAKLQQQRVALVDVGRILTGTGFTVRSLGSQLALFPLPVVAAIAAVALLGDALYKLATADSATEAAQKALNNVMGESKAETAGEAAQIQDLVGIVIDETNSRKLRSAAFADLQAQYPGAFKNMSLEKTSLQDLQVATDKLTDALIRQAQIKGLESAISDVAKRQADLLNQNATGFLKSLDVFDKARLVLSGGADAGELMANKFKEGNEEAAKLNDELKALLKTSLQLGDGAELGKNAKDSKTVQDQNIQYLEKTKSLIEGLSKADKNPLFKDFAQSADGALGDINFNIYKDNLDKATEAAISGAIDKGTFNQYATALKASFDKVASPNLASHIDFTLADTGTELETEFKTLQTKMDKYPVALRFTFNEDSIKDAEATAKMVSDILNNGISNGTTRLAEAIGGAIGSGKSVLQSAGKALITELGSLLEQLGQGLVKIASAKIALQEIAFSSPYVELAVGVAAEIAGAALISSAGKTHAFAEGGIVTGPTNALIGEAGPEVIFPLDKLNQFMGQGSTGQSVNVHVTGQLKGTDMMLLASRTAKQQGYV